MKSKMQAKQKTKTKIRGKTENEAKNLWQNQSHFTTTIRETVITGLNVFVFALVKRKSMKMNSKSVNYG